MFANRYIQGVKVPCVALYIVVVLFIIAYGYFIRRTGTRDVLEKKIIDRKGFEGCDGWGLTHLIFFAVLGVLYPGHYVQALAVSFGWEAVEDFLGTHKIEVSGKRLQLIGDTDADGKPTGNTDGYWYGRLSDVALNMSGYVLGSAFAESYWPNDYIRVPLRGGRPFSG